MGEPQLRIWGFQTSNNIKVRVTLGYKEIPYEFVQIDPSDRTRIVELSRQHTTPVMQHGDTVLYDSAAIMRYVDAQFPETPPIFGASLAEQWEIEDQELFARTRLAGPMLDVVHTRVTGGEVTEAMLARCAADWASATAELAERLEHADWLVGDQPTAADLTAAPVVFRVESARLFDHPLTARLVAWKDRVMAWDGRARSE